MNLTRRLFGARKSNSREIAKDRLQLVLVQDRVNISPKLLQALKDELIDVISKYVEIDVDGTVVTFQHNKRESRLTADIPVVGARSRS
jgi:cell division topological specificity factor